MRLVTITHDACLESGGRGTIDCALAKLRRSMLQSVVNATKDDLRVEGPWV